MSSETAGGSAAGHQLFLTHLTVIESVIAKTVARHRLPSIEAEDFAAEVRLKLLEDDCATLRQFKGASRLATFLTVVVGRLLLDYRNRAWGRWRPSAEAQRLGETAVLLERTVWRDGYSLREACEVLSAKQGLSESAAELEALFVRLPSRTRRRFESEDVLTLFPSGDAPDRDFERRHLRDVERRVAEVVSEVGSALDPQDRMILALRFEDGRKVSDIATTMGLEAKALYRRIERLLGQFRSEIRRAGIADTAITELLEEGTVMGGWLQQARENSGGGRL